MTADLRTGWRVFTCERGWANKLKVRCEMLDGVSKYIYINCDPARFNALCFFVEIIFILHYYSGYKIISVHQHQQGLNLLHL